MENEKELRQLFKDRSDCYTQLTEGGLKELVVEQAMTEDGFIDILNELERKKKEDTGTQVDNEALLVRVLKIGAFKLQKALESGTNNRGNVIWVEKDSGEGTDIDIAKVFENEM